MTARLILTRPPMSSRIGRAVALWWARWRLDALRSERERFERAGIAGPVYLYESRTQELALMRRVALLEGV